MRPKDDDSGSRRQFWLDVASAAITVWMLFGEDLAPDGLRRWALRWSCWATNRAAITLRHTADHLHDRYNREVIGL